MLAGSLSQEDEDAVLAELEAITQVSLISFKKKKKRLDHTFSKQHPALHFDSEFWPVGFWTFSQGDVELPEVPSDKLPDVPEAAEEQPGLLSHVFPSQVHTAAHSCSKSKTD